VSVAPFSVATAPVDDPLQDWQKAANLIRKV